MGAMRNCYKGHNYDYFVVISSDHTPSVDGVWYMPTSAAEEYFAAAEKNSIDNCPIPDGAVRLGGGEAFCLVTSSQLAETLVCHECGTQKDRHAFECPHCGYV